MYQTNRNKRYCLAVLLFLTCTVMTLAQDLNLRLQNVTIKKAITEIQKASGKSIIVESNGLNLDLKVTVSGQSGDAISVLETIFSQTEQNVDITEKQSTIYVARKVVKKEGRPENITVSGLITEENGAAIAGAVVTVSGNSELHSITDLDGKYEITVPSDAELNVSCLGYQPMAVNVANRANVNIVMALDRLAIDEVVVTALGITHSEKSLGYATQKFDGNKLEKVKGVNIATSLTGQISGMRVYNSTEFDQEPTIQLRGEAPLVVVDGIPTGQSLSDFNQDVIESITVLKGATASALYGSRGGNGAIMITTKKSGEKGFTVEVNSSNMFFSGYNKIPEVQSSYGTGSGGKFGDLYYVWGDKLDIGRTAYRWDPITKSMKDLPLVSSGKNNFKNFLEFSMVSNNSVSVSTKGEHGSIHSTLSYMYNKNPYPNTRQNKFWYSIGGELKLTDKLKIETTLNYSQSHAPQTAGYGWGTGYMYNILVWAGTDFDLRDYKDYWLVPNEKQNWYLTDWYDNPYFEAYEKIHSVNSGKINGSLSLKYNILPWMTLQLRAGGVAGFTNEVSRSSMGTCSYNRSYWKDGSKGYYAETKSTSMTMNYDALLLINKKFNDFSIDAVLGGSLYTYTYNSLMSETVNGLTIPGFYSLNASVELPYVYPGTQKKSVNSLFGTVTLGYKDTYFIEATGRNDWSSTLPSNEKSYFYPSVSGSIVGSQIIDMPQWFPFWKVRGSWALSKKDVGIYDINQDYTVTFNTWNGLTSATLPSSLRGNIKPITDRTWEVGATAYFLKDSRLKLDFAYYNKLTYNLTRQQTISASSGYSTRLMNINEEYVRRGFELSLSAGIIERKNFNWNAMLNLSNSRTYYARLDEEYSADKPWVGVGKRTDYYAFKGLLEDSEGNIIHGENGMPIKSQYEQLWGYSDPAVEFGFANSFRIKDFMININFDGRIGGVAWSMTDANMMQSGSHPDTDNEYRYDEVVNGKQSYIAPGVKVVSGDVEFDNHGQIIKDTRVFAENDIPTSYEGYWRGIYNDHQAFVFSKTFLKLRELSVGYNFPKKMYENSGLSNVYLGLIGQNLFILTKDFRFSDPDALTGTNEGLISPSVRYVGVNLKLEF